ncbi:MAG TPA: MFS transporter, partial [Burkholderiales bacterium]
MGRVPLVLLAAHILSMLGSQTYAALLPELREEWSMSNAQAGVVGGMFFAGYIATVSYWTALTDRVDARKVYLAGGLLAAAGGVGFGWAVSGFYTAILFQVMLGIGIAATYMPGLRILSDRISGPAQSRNIAFYTSFFGIGTALSLAIAGAVAPLAGWRAAFIVSAAGPLLAGLTVFLLIEKSSVEKKQTPFTWSALFPVAAWRKVLA